MLAMYGFHSENKFWIKIFFQKPPILNQFFMLYKVGYLEENIGCNLLNPLLLMVLLTIPFNELPCVSGIRPKNGQQNGQGRQSMKQTKSHNQKEYFEKSTEYMRFRSCQ